MTGFTAQSAPVCGYNQRNVQTFQVSNKVILLHCGSCLCCTLSPVFVPECILTVPGSDYLLEIQLFSLGLIIRGVLELPPLIKKVQIQIMLFPGTDETISTLWISINNWPRWGTVAMVYRFWQHCSLLPLWPSVVGGTLMSTTLFPGDSSWADRSAICFCDTMRYISVFEEMRKDMIIFSKYHLAGQPFK